MKLPSLNRQQEWNTERLVSVTLHLCVNLLYKATSFSNRISFTPREKWHSYFCICKLNWPLSDFCFEWQKSYLWTHSYPFWAFKLGLPWVSKRNKSLTYLLHHVQASIQIHSALWPNLFDPHTFRGLVGLELSTTCAARSVRCNLSSTGGTRT